jgi:LiaI-LiaF-like transmembrane region
MASSIHADTVAFCRKCGKPLTQETRREWQGIPYCQPCLDALQAAQPGPATEAEEPRADSAPRAETPPSGSFTRPSSSGRYAPAPGGTVSPALAGILGFIPGVGAVYNGQFAKGILHVMIFGLLVSIVAADGTGDLRPMFVFLVILTAIYMPIEAYRTARAIERGEPVEEFSGILSAFGRKKPSPAGGVVLIALGVIFLFNTLGYWRLGDLVQYWPVLLIALGIFMLYRSVSEQAREDRFGAFGGGPGLGTRAMAPSPRPPSESSESGVPEPVGTGEEAAESGSSELHPSNG